MRKYEAIESYSVLKLVKPKVTPRMLAFLVTQ